MPVVLFSTIDASNRAVPDLIFKLSVLSTLRLSSAINVSWFEPLTSEVPATSVPSNVWAVYVPPFSRVTVPPKSSRFAVSTSNTTSPTLARVAPFR